MAVRIYVNQFGYSGLAPSSSAPDAFDLESGMADMIDRLMRGGEHYCSGYCTGLIVYVDPEDPDRGHERILYDAPSALQVFTQDACWSLGHDFEMGSKEHEQFIRGVLLKSLTIQLDAARHAYAMRMSREDFLMAVVIAVERGGDFELFDGGD